MDGPILIDSTAEYTVSCQPSIWEKEFLKECIGSRNYNAWYLKGFIVIQKSTYGRVFKKMQS
jgi:hypothetical protein